MSPLRADAQRNYDAVVSAARETFAAKGTQASLDEIAEQAGVGNATLYRHFPTRDSLLVEALRFHLSELSAVSREVDLRGWVVALAEGLAVWRGLPDAVATATDDSPLRAALQPLQLATFKRLTIDGGVRADVTPEELFALITALAWQLDQGALPVERGAELLLTGVARR